MATTAVTVEDVFEDLATAKAVGVDFECWVTWEDAGDGRGPQCDIRVGAVRERENHRRYVFTDESPAEGAQTADGDLWINREAWAARWRSSFGGGPMDWDEIVDTVITDKAKARVEEQLRAEDLATADADTPF